MPARVVTAHETSPGIPRGSVIPYRAGNTSVSNNDSIPLERLRHNNGLRRLHQT
jgi:hypothetical protein